MLHKIFLILQPFKHYIKDLKMCFKTFKSFAIHGLLNRNNINFRCFQEIKTV